MLSLIPRLSPWPTARAVASVAGVWSQMSFSEGIAIDDVSEAPLLLSNASIVSNKLVNTVSTGKPMDRAMPFYLSASEDFSVEGWLNMSSIPDAAAILSMYAAVGTTDFSFFFGAQVGSVLAIVNAAGSDSSAGRINASAPAFTLNTDQHIALCRVSGVLTIYLNGNPIYSAANNTAPFKATEFLGIRNGAIGKRWNMRVCRGISAYSAAFVPPLTLAPIAYPTYAADVQADILLQVCLRRNVLINEANLAGVTLSGGAIVQNGRLMTSAVNGSRYSMACAYFGAGNFTIECKVRLPVNPATAESSILGQYGNSFDANSNWLLWTSGSRGVVFYWVESDGTARSVSSASNTLPLNVDAHIVVEKVGTTVTMYFDGVSVGTTASPRALIDRSALRPVRSAWDEPSTANTLNVTNIRIAKRAMYNGVIKPTPTFPKMVYADYIDFIASGVPATWTTKVSTSQVAGGVKIAPGAYIVVPSSASYILGAGDFTIDMEFSIQSTQASSGNTSRFTEFLFWSTFAAPSQPINYEFHYDHVNSQFTLSAGASSYRTMPFAITLNQVYKVQLTREGSRLQLWVDGIKISDLAFVEDFQYDVVTPLYIGRRIGGTAADVVWNSDWTCKTLRLSKKPRSQLTVS